MRSIGHQVMVSPDKRVQRSSPDGVNLGRGALHKQDGPTGGRHLLSALIVNLHG